MYHTSPTILFLTLAVAALVAFATAAIAFALARWEGASIPAALSRGGVAFAAGLTLCLAILSAVTR
ncbi:hypothetical protein [Streptomyces sp. NPDC059862]|uniref:hypothetical protein n=1 Tax=unclassified Streptomyces TaxID=2593676 RepID=UPI0036276EEC